MAKRIIALDISTTCMGVCIAKGYEFLAACYYQPSSKLDAYDRVQDMAGWLAEKLKEFRSDVLIIEFPSGVHNNMDTNVKVGYAFGEMLSTFRWWFDYRKVERGQEIIVRPSEVKKTGYHKDDFTLAEELLGEPIVYETEAERKRLGNMVDSIGVWKAGENEIKR